MIRAANPNDLDRLTELYDVYQMSRNLPLRAKKKEDRLPEHRSHLAACLASAGIDILVWEVGERIEGFVVAMLVTETGFEGEIGLVTALYASPAAGYGRAADEMARAAMSAFESQGAVIMAWEGKNRGKFAGKRVRKAGTRQYTVLSVNGGTPK